VLNIHNYLQNPKVLKELVKKLGAVNQTTNQLFTKVAKLYKTVLASSNLKAIIKPKRGHVYKNWPFI
jgi:hypothetical protein